MWLFEKGEKERKREGEREKEKEGERQRDSCGCTAILHDIIATTNGKDVNSRLKIARTRAAYLHFAAARTICDIYTASIGASFAL